MTQLERFQKTVEEESRGMLKIDGFIGAQLGNEQDTMRQAARGRIDPSGFSTNAVAVVVPEMIMLVLPFYFRTVAESDCAIDALTRPLTEWAPAFQSGAIDAASRSATFYVPSGLNKVAPVLSRLEMWSNPAFIVISKGIYDNLSAPRRDALQHASARISAAENRKELRAFESMIRGIHEKGGGQVAQANCRVTV